MCVCLCVCVCVLRLSFRMVFVYSIPRTVYRVHAVHYTLYDVRSTLYAVYCTAYSIPCTVYCVRRTVYHIQCSTMYSIPRTVYRVHTVHCTVYRVQYTAYVVQCITYSAVRCTLYSMQVQCMYCMQLQCIQYTIRRTVYAVQCTAYTVAAYTVPRTVHADRAYLDDITTHVIHNTLSLIKKALITDLITSGEDRTVHTGTRSTMYGTVHRTAPYIVQLHTSYVVYCKSYIVRSTTISTTRTRYIAYIAHALKWTRMASYRCLEMGLEINPFARRVYVSDAKHDVRIYM